MVSNNCPLAAGLKLTHAETNDVLLVDAGDTLARAVHNKSIQTQGKDQFAEACEDVAWNPDSEKYTYKERPVQSMGNLYRC